MFIGNTKEVQKLGAFLRVKSRGIFHINKELLADVMEFLKKYSAESGENIEIQFVSSDAERIILFASGGAIAGATLGFIVWGGIGFCVGLAVGAIMGYELAHIKLSVYMDGDDVVLQLA